MANRRDKIANCINTDKRTKFFLQFGSKIDQYNNLLWKKDITSIERQQRLKLEKEISIEAKKYFHFLTKQ